VPEPTMGQRISRAKTTLASADEPFALPDDTAYFERLSLVLRVVYLIFNEGYASTTGTELDRIDLAAEAIRLGGLLHDLMPDEGEVTGLLALMLLSHARRAGRITASGALIPLAEQDRSQWDHVLIAEGTRLASLALEQSSTLPGEYVLQASIAALHDQAVSFVMTDWSRILMLYTLLEQVSNNPVVCLNRAVALAMVEGPDAGLQLLDQLAAAGRLPSSHRVPAVRAHLLEQQGNLTAARQLFVEAAARCTNARERDYLTVKAATLGPAGPKRTA